MSMLFWLNHLSHRNWVFNGWEMKGGGGVTKYCTLPSWILLQQELVSSKSRTSLPCFSTSGYWSDAMWNLHYNLLLSRHINTLRHRKWCRYWLKVYKVKILFSIKMYIILMKITILTLCQWPCIFLIIFPIPQNKNELGMLVSSEFICVHIHEISFYKHKTIVFVMKW